MYYNLGMLKEKTFIVTGGSKGIGYFVSEYLLSRGAKLVICSRQARDVRNAVLTLRKLGTVYGLASDVSRPSECRHLIQFALRKFKRIDVLVNNAGIYGPIGPIETLSAKDWQETLQVNLLGIVHCTQAVIPIMKRQGGGKIINFCGAGVGGNSSLPRFSAYYTSKVAVAGFTEVLADELIDNNIQVNAIFPGAVNTNLVEYLLAQGPEKPGPKVYQQALEQKKNGGTPPILAANLIGFLASDQASHITGRLLSAKWDDPKRLVKPLASSNLYKLRRVDNQLYHETKK